MSTVKDSAAQFVVAGKQDRKEHQSGTPIQSPGATWTHPKGYCPNAWLVKMAGRPHSPTVRTGLLPELQPHFHPTGAALGEV